MSKTFEIELTELQVNAVLAGLGQLPLKDALDVFNTIHKQCTEQSNEEDK